MAAKSRLLQGINDSVYSTVLSSLAIPAFTFVRTKVIDITLSFCQGVMAASFWLVVLNANRHGGSLGQASHVCLPQ
jgi:hypothetical protein